MASKYYADIFKHSGASYHRAMQGYPAARAEEFDTALSLLKLKDGERLLDIPAGGGYLQRYINDSIDYEGYDFAGSFSGHEGNKVSNGNDNNNYIGLCSETSIPLASHSIDKAICLASMHHVKDKTGFLNEVKRCMKTGGKFMIGDVVAGSKEAVFLNGFVDIWNSLGHQGDFINAPRDLAMLNQAGFSANFSVRHYKWNFINQSRCQTFLRQLFNLDKAPSDDQLAGELYKLGTRTSGAGFHLNWSLGFLTATKL